MVDVLDRLELMALMGNRVEGTEANPLRDWVTVVPGGYVKSSQGDFILDAQAAKTVIANHAQKGIDIVIDYEHQSLGGDYKSPDGKAPAAGWITELKYVMGDGLLGLVRWGARAAQDIMDSTYRYLSPVLLLDTQTRRAVAIHSVALTNTPAIRSFPPLKEFKQMINTDRLILQDGDPPSEPADDKETGQSADTIIVAIREVLSLPETTAPEDVLKAALEVLLAREAENTETTAASIAKALDLADGSGPTEVVAAIDLLKTSRVSPVQHLALRQELIELEVETLLDKYSKQGRLTQAMYNNERVKLLQSVEHYDERKREFLALMASVPVIIPQGAVAMTESVGNPAHRETVIRKAASRFGAEPELTKSTSKVAWIDAELQDKDLPQLTADERAKFG